MLLLQKPASTKSLTQFYIIYNIYFYYFFVYILAKTRLLKQKRKYCSIQKNYFQNQSLLVKFINDAKIQYIYKIFQHTINNILQKIQQILQNAFKYIFYFLSVAIYSKICQQIYNIIFLYSIKQQLVDYNFLFVIIVLPVKTIFNKKYSSSQIQKYQNYQKVLQFKYIIKQYLLSIKAKQNNTTNLKNVRNFQLIIQKQILNIFKNIIIIINYLTKFKIKFC
eukprot:TRINITY_DN990_c0_g1_i1.p1 TRINITY_DN990_c0_g1~~TRINITY_DN990_c0_g1_i1.p1  ORF type:complete len:222 (-),score=-20.50 TRINITY_DN990_c0_g1_i1:106-771(-)